MSKPNKAQELLEKFNNNPTWKKYQRHIAAGIAVLGLGVIMFGGNAPRQEKTSPDVKVDSAVFDADKAWRYNVDQKVDHAHKSTEERMRELEKKLSEQQAKLIEAMNKSEERIHAQMQQNNQAMTQRVRFLTAGDDSGTQKSSQERAAEPEGPVIGMHRIENTKAKSEPLKTKDNYIAAGSIAGGVLMSGIDVSTSVSRMSDPDPVLVRLTDDGQLPNRFRSHLHECHIIGSAYGDISSERAKIRLEKLSCLEKQTGEVVETNIAGYVTSEDGRQGIRGKVVSLDAKHLRASLASGLLGGLGAAAKKPAPSPIVIGNTTSTPSPSMNDNIRGGMMDGMGGSLERLSNYYISKAESIQPVIQIAAGRKIDIVFTQGTFIGDTEVRRAISAKSDIARKVHAQKAAMEAATESTRKAVQKAVGVVNDIGGAK